MARIKKELDAWPESSEEPLSLIERFERLQKKHSKEYTLSLFIFCVPASRAEINAVLIADDKLTTAGALLAKKLDFWS